MPPTTPKNKTCVQLSHKTGDLVFATIDLKMSKEPKPLLIKWPCRVEHVLDLKKEFFTRKRKDSNRGPYQKPYLVSMFGCDTFMFVSKDEIYPYKNNLESFKKQDPANPERKPGQGEKKTKVTEKNLKMALKRSKLQITVRRRSQKRKKEILERASLRPV